MKKSTEKFLISVSAAALLLLFAVFSFLGQNFGGGNFVFPAEADEEGSEGGSEGSGSGDEDGEETVTTYVKLPDQVIKRSYTITIYDSDGDGVFDPQDPTPNVHDAFLVKDEDWDGVDDQYAEQ